MLSPSPKIYFFSRMPIWNYDSGLKAPSQLLRTMADHVVCKPSEAPLLGQSSQHPVHSTSPRLALQPTIYVHIFTSRHTYSQGHCMALVPCCALSARECKHAFNFCTLYELHPCLMATIRICDALP